MMAVVFYRRFQNYLQDISHIIYKALKHICESVENNTIDQKGQRKSVGVLVKVN